MHTAVIKILALSLTPTVLALSACTTTQSPKPHSHHNAPHPSAQAALDYLKDLDGQWTVDGGKEGTFGWEFDTTSRDAVVLERLKVGTPTEMTTVYSIDDGALVASHFCQLGNHPRLTAVAPSAEGQLDFLCDGHLAAADSHADLHMHGVHFKHVDDSVVIWMDMHKDGQYAFETRYTLKRTTD